LGEHSELIRSLYWRDFFTSIALYFPHVFEGAFHSKFDKLKWSDDKSLFRLWCEGKTGFPLVDAGMREMNATGFMHNRVRMVVGSFLTKDLHINWRWGEKYFAQTLIDYDPAVNNGNWQWVASTGCDAQPYFRIFNPWSQQRKFDPDCRYIKKWVPELSTLPPEVIHKWYEKDSWTKHPNYSPPVVDHDKEAKIALELYRML
jgi:deoxyribodipyrimidine photo-lyase